MKTLIQKVTKLILATLMFFTSLSINNMVVYAEDPSVKVLKLGETYLIGDKIEISEDNVWISFVDKDNTNDSAALKGIYTLPEPTFDDYNQDWGFESFIEVQSDLYWGLYFYNGVSAEKNPIGIKCISGEGTQSSPFKFELMYDADLIINAIDVTITQPIAGDTVSGDWNNQQPRPAVSIHGSNYYIGETEVFWFDDIETYDLFEGEFVENEYYYFGVPLYTEYGYEFVGNSSDLTVNITNGEFVKFADYEATRLAMVGKVKCKAASQTKELKVGEKYLIGDTIKLTNNATICFDNENGVYAEIADTLAGEYTLPEPKFYPDNPPVWGFEYVIETVSNGWYGFYFRDEEFEASNKPIGIECISGDGTSANPFMFEPLFDEGPVINKVKLTITQPIAGDTVSGDWLTQTPSPEVKVPSSARYNVEIENVHWFNADLTVFAGTFEENEYYYFLVPLYTEDGFTFVGNSSDLTVNITNGELAQFYYYEPTRLGIIGKVKCKPASQTNELKVGEEYLIGDKIKVSEGTWIHFSDDGDEPNDVLEGEYELPEPRFDNFNQDWGFESFIKVQSGLHWGLYFYDGVSAEKKPIGVKCIAGEGTQSSPFIFKPIYDNLIKNVEFTVTPPVDGVTVTITGGDQNTQNPHPHVSVPGSVVYELDSGTFLSTYWRDEEGAYFTGTFVEGEDYYAEVWLRSKVGYDFSEELNVTVNDKTIKKDGVDENYYIVGDRLIIKVKVQCKPASQIKELKVGEEYLIGDTIQLSADAYIRTDDEYLLAPPDEIKNGDYTLNKPNFILEIGQYEFVNLFVDPEEANYSLYLGYDTGLTGSEKVKGIKCISGNGTEQNPFVFELMFETPLDPTIIDKVEFTIVPPKPGDIVTAVGSDWSTQNPRPVMNIPDDAKFTLYNNEILWTNSNGTLFTGEFIEGEDYYVYVTLVGNSGYTFADSPTLNVINSEEIKLSEVYDTNHYFDVWLKIKCQKAPTTHKVTFVLNGGEMSPSEVYVEDGEYLKSYEYEPTRVGQYDFAGWYTDSGCQNEFRWWETPIESALTLYAKWSEYYVIKYDFGGGVLWGETSTTFNYPKEWDGTEKIPSIEEMKDWNYEAPVGKRYVGVNVNGKQYLPGEEVKITGNTTVTLINLPIDKDILTFKLDGGKLGDQEGVAFLPYDKGSKINLPTPTKSGYTFDYWEGSKYYGGDAYTVNGDHTFKAIWKSPSPVKPTPVKPTPVKPIAPVIVPVPNTGVK